MILKATAYLMMLMSGGWPAGSIQLCAFACATAVLMPKRLLWIHSFHLKSDNMIKIVFSP